MGKKLLLINPVDPNHKTLSNKLKIPPLPLAIIAALTPDYWDIEIVDENFNRFEYKDADLVGITSYTSTANRTYDIAKLYREKGITTVIGGIHASFLTEEALQHVDVVVIGEVEGVWDKLIADFEADKMQKIYRGVFKDLKGMPAPRVDLYNPKLRLGTIQTARGCPLNCDFCSVTAFNGGKYRYRPINEVLDELEKITKKWVFFLDDNIVGYGKKNEERAVALFKGIIERGIKKTWFSHASMNFAENEDVLKYAAKSGCRMVMLGVEAEDVDSLKEINKTVNIKVKGKSYEDIFRRINKYGIAVHGFFIYGMDVDTSEKLYRRTNYISKSAVDAMQVAILTPLPGTKLFNRHQDAKRLLYTNFPADWARYDFSEITFKPLLLEAKQFEEIMTKTYRRLYSRRSILYRFFRTWFFTRNIISSFFAVGLNKAMREAFLKDRCHNDKI